MSDSIASEQTERLKARAQLLAQVRLFFAEQGVLEVETPILSRFANTDPFLESFSLKDRQTNNLYLQTSPELAMKRLLVSGSGSIFQICKSFRQDEEGKRHNPEFTMLEWYMLDWTLAELMGQVDQLIEKVLGLPNAERLSFQEVFEKKFSINPHQVELTELQQLVKEHCKSDANNYSKDECLNLIFADQIEPNLGWGKPSIIFDYPETQSALAEIKHPENDTSYKVADRFEIFVNGVEVANAYQELLDPAELVQRSEKENKVRDQLNKEQVRLDENFRLAMEKGLPKCAGIALGLDRLLMLKMGKENIKDVLAFPFDKV